MLKTETTKHKRTELLSNASTLCKALVPSLPQLMELARENSASNWLTALPMDKCGFALHKGAFRNTLALCYG